MKSLCSAPKTLISAALLSLLPAAAAVGAGLFTGDYDLGTPSLYSATAGAPVSTLAGKWQVNIEATGSGAIGRVDTTSAPNSVHLFASVHNVLTAGGHASPAVGAVSSSALAKISLTASTAGTFGFDLTEAITTGSPDTGSVYAFVGSTTYSLVGSSTYSLTLAAGDTFGFATESTSPFAVANGGHAGLAGLPGLTGSLAGSGLTLSNIVFTPVPEASSVGAGLALLGMGIGAWFRARRRA